MKKYLFNSGIALWDKLHHPNFVRSPKWEESSLSIKLYDKSNNSTSLKPLNWFFFKSLIWFPFRLSHLNFFIGTKVSTGSEVNVPEKQYIQWLIPPITKTFYSYLISCKIKYGSLPLLISSLSILCAARLSTKISVGNSLNLCPFMFKIVKFPKICIASFGNFSIKLPVICSSCKVLLTPRKLCSSMNFNGVSMNFKTLTFNGYSAGP